MKMAFRQCVALFSLGFALAGFAEVERHSSETLKDDSERSRGVSTQMDLGNGNSLSLSGSENKSDSSSITTRDGQTSAEDNPSTGNRYGAEFSHSDGKGGTDSFGVTGGDKTSKDGKDGNLGFSYSHTDKESVTQTSDDGKTTVEDTVKSTDKVSMDGKSGVNGGSAQIGVSHTEQVSEETRHGDKDGSNWGHKESASVKGELTAGVANDGKGKLTAEMAVGVTTEVKVSMDGRYGDDQYNVHGEGELKMTAEMAAAIKGTLQVNEEGVVTTVEGKVGASLSAQGEIKGGITVMGVPLDVKLTGAVSVGAEASAKAGFVFDPATGKAKVVLEASAVLGAGAKGGIEVEVGVKQLAELVAKIDPVKAVYNAGEYVGYKTTMWVLGDDSEYVQKLLAEGTWQDKLLLILSHTYEKGGGKDSDASREFLKTLVNLVEKGGSPWRAIMIARDYGDGDTNKVLQQYSELQKEARNQQAKNQDGNVASPLDEPPEGESDQQNGNTVNGLTPFKAY